MTMNLKRQGISFVLEACPKMSPRDFCICILLLLKNDGKEAACGYPITNSKHYQPKVQAVLSIFFCSVKKSTSSLFKLYAELSSFVGQK